MKVSARKPLFLLADSQLLFGLGGGAHLLDSVKSLTGTGSPVAAYVGASNGDAPEYFALFKAAMESRGVGDCRMVRSPPRPHDLDALGAAHVILLSGGDPAAGWRRLGAAGLEVVARRYEQGAVLLGVSAGAIQLGLYLWPGETHAGAAPPAGFGFAPYLVGVHEEGDDWRGLKAALVSAPPGVSALAIPTGGGLLYHPHGVCEAIRRHALVLTRDGDGFAERKLSPQDHGPADSHR